MESITVYRFLLNPLTNEVRNATVRNGSERMQAAVALSLGFYPIHNVLHSFILTLLASPEQPSLRRFLSRTRISTG